jgi:hypothetical protein
MGHEEEILKKDLYPMDVVPLGARLFSFNSREEESLIDLCRRMRMRLETDHVVCPEAKATEISRAIRTSGSAIRSALEDGFYRLVTIEVSRGLDASERFDLDGRFLPYVREILYTSFGVDPTDNFHPEQVSQVVKDEPPSLFCFLDAQFIPEPELQRLRIFTQGHHRVLLCALPPPVDNTEVPPAVDGRSEGEVHPGRVDPDSHFLVVAEDGGRGHQVHTFVMISDEPKGPPARDRFLSAFEMISDVPENFRSWDSFLNVYYEPIRTALALMPFVGVGRADDVAQDFFMKLYERDLLAKQPTITGRFRDWLYVSARHHALDEWRKTQRRSERLDAIEADESADLRNESSEELPFDADEIYALSILQMAVARVRKHLVELGKSEHWMIFDELALTPLKPGRIAKSREELLAMFPGEGPEFLDNRLTSVKRVFRRILPALIPVDPTETRTAEQRFQELLWILGASRKNRLWLALLTDPMAGPEESARSSLDLTAHPAQREMSEAAYAPDDLHDELRILLDFWLEMPMREYLEDLEGVGPAVAAAIRDSRPSGPLGRHPHVADPLNLKRLISTTDSTISEIPAVELVSLLQRLKTFAKRVQRSRPGRRGLGRTDRQEPGTGRWRLEDAIPFEIAQVLYNLAGALALVRYDTRIIGISDEQYRKNLVWFLGQSWLDARLRPLFFAALSRLRTGNPS